LKDVARIFLAERHSENTQEHIRERDLTAGKFA
jgi:hypothetical protein